MTATITATLHRKATAAENLAKLEVDKGRIAALQMTAHALRRAEFAYLCGRHAGDETAMADSAERALANVYGIRLH